MDTVQPAFYEKMIGSVFARFSSLFVMGIRIEQGMKNGKIITIVGTCNNNAKKFSRGFQKKKEGKTNVVSTGKVRNY